MINYSTEPSEVKECSNCLFEYTCNWKPAGENDACADWKPEGEEEK